MTVYVFDMDGTLTPARLPMTESCAERFYCWQKTHLSFIATGSDYAKVKEQLPEKVINAFTAIRMSAGILIRKLSSIWPILILTWTKLLTGSFIWIRTTMNIWLCCVKNLCGTISDIITKTSTRNGFSILLKKAANRLTRIPEA